MTQAFQRVMLATEHGEFDVGAERIALALAAACGASLHTVMAVLSNIEAQSVAPELIDLEDERAAAAITEIASLAQGRGIAFSSAVCHVDDIADAFARQALQAAADVMVVRRRGRRGWLSRLLVGEMVGRLIDQSPCDVLVAPRAAQMWTKGVLVLTDASAAQSPAMQRAGALAIAAGVPLMSAPLSVREAQSAAAHADLVVMDMPAMQPHRLSGVREQVIGAAECAVLLCASA